jgi:hypothetical protein
MKRAIAGFLLLVGMAVSPALAFDGGKDLPRDARRDDARVAQDRYESRRDLDRNDYRRDYPAAHHERRDLRRDYRDGNRDGRELYWDRR